MNKVVKWTTVGAAILVAGALLLEIQQSSRIRTGVTIGPVSVGGLTPAQARLKLKHWWHLARVKPIALESSRLAATQFAIPSDMAVAINLDASLRRAPRGSLADIFSKPNKAKLTPVLTMQATRVDSLATA